jgi:hypothetical protein
MRTKYPRLRYIVFFTFIFQLLTLNGAIAQLVKGLVTDKNGKPVAYASVYVKGGKEGTTTNPDGKYQFELSAGNYTLVCAHISFNRQERSLTVAAGKDHLLDFSLADKQVELGEVVVKAGAEDPAYEIMRKAIAKRKDHLGEVADVQSEVYMKGLIRTSKVPRTVFGQKVELNKDIFDSLGRGILYFSESVTNYSKRENGDYREEVVSAKVSGNSSGFGFNSPRDLDINFYESNIQIEGLNSRGFVSPLNDNALHYYRFFYLGSFYEDGLEINKILVSPKRLYEPLFSGGYVNIIEGSWRIHSVQLALTKTSQIELVDSMLITQEMSKIQTTEVWLPRYTRIEAKFGVLGIRASADFAAVFKDYSLETLPGSYWKGNIVKSIDTSANKKSMVYWDSLRPIPLSVEELKDYTKKDSLETKFKDPAYLDSLDKIANKWKTFPGIFTSQTFTNRKKKSQWTIPGAIYSVSYNTVEQWAFCFEPSFRKWSDTGSFTFSPRVRYNTGLNRFYADATFGKRIGRDYRKRWNITIGGGKYMFQINPDNPIQPLNNTLATLLYTRNYMKVYEKTYGRLAARRVLGSTGLSLTLNASFEDRNPLENTDTTFRWRSYKDRRFTSNYPEELPPGYFDKHQAFITGVNLRFQPGVKYIQYPGRLVSMGSDAPVFTLQLTKAWRGIFGSDAEFGKWLVKVTDEFNMKLGGEVKYNLSTGGFIKNQNVQLPDWQHFMGNQTIVASPFVRSYQLAPYYANSTGDDWFAAGHLEWHLNGLLTNKIPLLRKANINLVTGSNAFYVDAKRNYFEMFLGLENILKTLRVDYVWGWDGASGKWVNGVVVGFGGLFSGGADD